MSAKAIKFLKSLKIPEGPRAGKRVRLAPFQVDFIRGALQKNVSTAVLSVARGNGKSAISGGLGLGALLGVWDAQPRREIIIAARSRDQAKICWSFVEGFARSLPEETQAQFKFRRSTREIEFLGNGGGVLKAIAADAGNALGGSATLAVLDERGHWPVDSGDALEGALLSSLGKRGGKGILISTSAATDSHPFSRWIDNPPDRTFVKEYRPAPGLPADDLESLMVANPGSRYGIGASEDWLVNEARRAIQRGGTALANFRLLNRNERVSTDGRDLLLTVDQWLAVEVTDVPPRDGPLVVGLDLGGSVSMSAWANFWPTSGRLEAYGAFPTQPGLLDRGQSDGVGDRYVQMKDRGELMTLGGSVVPVEQFISKMLAHLDGYPIATICCDRFRQAEFVEAVAKTGARVVPTFRGQGFRDGAEDVERFRRSVFDGKVKVAPSLLLRSAFADAVTLTDPAGNSKLAKGRADSRIDAAAATILAVAHGDRMTAMPARKARAPVWL